MAKLLPGYRPHGAKLRFLSGLRRITGLAEAGTRTALDMLINQQNLFDARSQYPLSKYIFLRTRLELDRSASSVSIDDVKDIARMLTVDAGARLLEQSADGYGTDTDAAACGDAGDRADAYDCAAVAP